MRLAIKIPLITIAGLTLFIAAALYYLHPIFKPFPIPTGPYGVGTHRLHLIDQSRSDARQASGHIEIIVEFYYPTDPCNRGKQFEYHAETLKGIARAQAQDSYIPKRVWEFLVSGIMSYAQPQGIIDESAAPYPVIIFLPGISGDPLYNVYLEEISSHGYGIIFIIPPFDVRYSALPEEQEGFALDPQLQQAIATNNRDAISQYRLQAHANWLADVRFVLQELQTTEEDNPIITSLDFNRLAAVGHSHGGWVALDFCAQDDRCKAAIDMDGWTKGVIIKSFEKPVLLMENAQGLDELSRFSQKMGSYAHIVKIPGAEHRSFSDYIMLKWPLYRIYGIAQSNPDKIRKDIQKNILRFLNQYLK